MLGDLIGKIDGASIGGSGTWGMRFPEDLPEGKVTRYIAGIETPYGLTMPWKVIDVDGARILRVAFHGTRIREGQSIGEGALQTAWVLSEVGVPWAIVDASVGGIQKPGSDGELLPPGSLVIPNSFELIEAPAEFRREIVNLMRKHSGERRGTARMGDCFHPDLKKAWLYGANETGHFPVYEGGNYVTTPWGPFETAAEINRYKRAGFHIVGRTLGYEAYLARVLGYPLAACNIISNYAEGQNPEPEWVEGGMVEFYHRCARPMGEITMAAIRYILEHGIDESHDEVYRTRPMDIFPVDGA